MENQPGAYLIDLRHFIGSTKEDYTAVHPYERMMHEYPLATTHFLQTLKEDMLEIPFLVVMCKSGNHRAPALINANAHN